MRRPLRFVSRRRLVGGATALVVALAGCRSPHEPDPRYRPAENVLEVIAVLRRHVPDDTYRFEPAHDFTGKNVYRASLVRIENLERIHGDALRSGNLEDVIAFAKGRALERLRAFELAAASYRRAAARGDALRREALRSAALCDGLAEAAEIGFDADRPTQAAPPVPASTGQEIAAYDSRVALLEALADEVRDTHYAAVVREEIERADVLRARYATYTRRTTPDGNVFAVSQWQRVSLQHRESKNANRHLLELADLYETLAREYVEAHPPEGLGFDPASFSELADATVRVYEMVARQDGTAERIEASRRLEAFLSFTLTIDRDRFSH
ncbi:MAG: hypothetical protein JSU66_12065 [Deltaproteobacteria bacterium]|nr:MAG: hypothetical protein JSU66_12065 [Deltaproteobacteria bacterium]